MNQPFQPNPAWPAHLRPGALRWARASRNYEETVAFYRDLVGLPIVDSFASSFGEDGTIFGLPDTSIHLEIVRAHPGDQPGGASDQLVLYFKDAAAVAAATELLHRNGHTPAVAPPAYWKAHGAVVFDDPDGRSVIYAPWVYGLAAEPGLD